MMKAMTITDQTMSLAPRADRSHKQSIDPVSYRSVMRSHAGAVTILSTGRPGDRTGLTATSVCSLSDAPPQVVACVNRSASAHGLIRQSGAFGVNLLRSGQADLANLFAGRHGIDREQRFDANCWTSLATGAPILRNALANLDCELFDEHPHETHSIFVGNVKAIRIHDEDDPLIYFGGKFCSLARD
jgi:flavin reductase (DIM6/NTAB) family NADH-FMN oxidoreductase RutF